MSIQENTQIIRWCLLSTIILIGLLISACQPGNSQQTDDLNGTVLLWHDLGEKDASVMDQVLVNYMGIHPDVDVIATTIPSTELRYRFEEAVHSGLGPDLLLGPSSWIKPLADEGRIQPIDGLVEPAYWDRFIPASIAVTQYNEQFFAIPESLRMMGLYYNKRLVDEAPASLSELSEQVNQGMKIGMSPEFAELFWGIGAFGGRLLDEDGQVVLDRGGFANWLDWLSAADNGPNFLIDRDRETLRTLFDNQELAYLVDGSWAAQTLQGRIGEENLGVAPLPDGPIGSASPLLETNAFMLSVASSQHQSELAVDLAKFITNPDQATTLMRRGDRIPASTRVQISPSVDPIAYAFVTQARNAIPFVNSSTMDAVMEVGSNAYNRALQGVEGPVEVANNISSEINQALGISETAIDEPTCLQLGVLEIWHALDSDDTPILQTIVNGFRAECPYILVRLRSHTPEVLLERLLADTGPLPDIALVPSKWVTALAEAQTIRSLMSIIPPETLQVYEPTAVQSWMVEERLYGAPFALQLPVLYYNRALVDDPARTLDDLISEGTMERPTALNVTFDQAFWGIPAFGGELFDDDARVVLDQGGFVDWLSWLQEAHARADVVLDTETDHLLELFLSGSVAYYVAGPDALVQIEEVLGKENVGVTQLPTGPIADADPLLTSLGFILPSKTKLANTDDEKDEMVLRLIQALTDVESQQLLMDSGRKVPANIAVDYSNDPAMAAFLERLSGITVYPNLPEMVAVEQYGNRAYQSILDEETLSQAELEELVADITETINVANGFPASEIEDEDSEKTEE